MQLVREGRRNVKMGICSLMYQNKHLIQSTHMTPTCKHLKKQWAIPSPS